MKNQKETKSSDEERTANTDLLDSDSHLAEVDAIVINDKNYDEDFDDDDDDDDDDDEIMIPTTTWTEQSFCRR